VLDETVDWRGKMSGDKVAVGYEDECGGHNDYYCYSMLIYHKVVIIVAIKSTTIHVMMITNFFLLDFFAMTKSAASIR
jgi:hypothetical protein